MNWFHTRSPRERQVLVGGAAVLAALLFYLVAWEPLTDRERELAARVAQQREQLAWMRSAAAELRTMTPRGSPGTEDGGSLLSVIDRSANDAGLASAVRRLAPEGDGRVRVWLGDAPYRTTVRWLESLARRGVVPLSVQMERGESAGQVEVRLLLSRPA